MRKSKPKWMRKDANVYPPSWDYHRVKAVADYYDARKDEVFLRDRTTTFVLREPKRPKDLGKGTRSPAEILRSLRLPQNDVAANLSETL